MVDLHDWVDIKQDPEFYRTESLDNWEYAIMRAINNVGKASVEKIYSVVSSFIIKPKSVTYDLTKEQFKELVAKTLASLKKRGLVAAKGTGWILVEDNSIEEERKRLLELYVKSS